MPRGRAPAPRPSRSTYRWAVWERARVSSRTPCRPPTSTSATAATVERWRLRNDTLTEGRPQGASGRARPERPPSHRAPPLIRSPPSHQAQVRGSKLHDRSCPPQRCADPALHSCQNGWASPFALRSTHLIQGALHLRYQSLLGEAPGRWRRRLCRGRPCSRLARDLPETGLRATLRRLTTQPLAAPLTGADG
jgi:hypothetical protein